MTSCSESSGMLAASKMAFSNLLMFVPCLAEMSMVGLSIRVVLGLGIVWMSILFLMIIRDLCLILLIVLSLK